MNKESSLPRVKRDFASFKMIRIRMKIIGLRMVRLTSAGLAGLDRQQITRPQGGEHADSHGSQLEFSKDAEYFSRQGASILFSCLLNHNETRSTITQPTSGTKGKTPVPIALPDTCGHT
jgi:hypothetical protein